MLKPYKQKRHSIIKRWIHFSAISILVFTGLYAEPIDKTNDVKSPSTKTIVKDTNQHLDSTTDAEAANNLDLSENKSDMVKKIDKILPKQDLTKLQTEQNSEKAEDDDDVLSDKALAKIDATVDTWNPKTAIENNPRLANKDLDKLQIKFFLQKISNINLSKNQFTARFHVTYTLPLARTEAHSRQESLETNKKKDLAQLQNVMRELAHDSREITHHHPGLYLLIYKYLKNENVTLADIRHAMTQNENTEQQLYALAMNVPVSDKTGAALSPAAIDTIHFLTRAQYICREYSYDDELCKEIGWQDAFLQGTNEQIALLEKKIGLQKEGLKLFRSKKSSLSHDEQEFKLEKMNTSLIEMNEKLLKARAEKQEMLQENKRLFARLNLHIACQYNPKADCLPVQIAETKDVIADLEEQPESNSSTENAQLSHAKEKLLMLKRQEHIMLSKYELTRPSDYIYNPINQLLSQPHDPISFKHDIQQFIGDLERDSHNKYGIADETDPLFLYARGPRLFKKQYPALTAMIESFIYQTKIPDEAIRRSIARLFDDRLDTFENSEEQKKVVEKLLKQFKQAKSFQQSLINNESFSQYLKNDPWAQFYIPNATINENDKTQSDVSRGMVTLSSRYTATINTHFDLKQYPFDKQTFKITIADKHNTSQLHDKYGLAHDFKISFKDPSAPIFNTQSFPTGWKLVGHQVKFTDLADTGKGKEPAAQLSFTLQRESARAFFTTFATLYLAYILSVIALSLTNKAGFFTAKNALMLGSIFSLMSNINSTQGLLQSHSSGLSLIDKFQIITMSLLLLSIISMYSCMWLNQNERVKRARIIRLSSVTVSLVAFILTNILLLI